jgi:hypothetical protein
MKRTRFMFVMTWMIAKIWKLTKGMKRLPLVPRGKEEVDNLEQELCRLVLR